MQRKIKIAIASFDIDQYSETFIKAHRERLDGEVFSYYGGFLPSKLVPYGALPLGNKLLRLLLRVYGKICLKRDLYDYQVALRESLAANKIDVFFAEYGQTGVWCLEVCRDLNLPLIVHFHGADATEEAVLIEYADRYPELFSYAAYIIAVSEKMRRDLINLGAPAEKIKITRCAPQENFYNINPDFSTPHFLQIGRLIELKAPLDTIQAFAKVNARCPDSRLTICGEGELFEACNALVKELGLTGRVDLPGAVSPRQVADYMVKSIALIHPSVTIGKNRTEGGCSVAILEAMAAGLPVIATDSGGIPDVIVHGENGFLIPEHAIAEMADCMLKLLDDTGSARKMGECGRLAAKNKYSMDQHIGLLNQLIKKSN